MRCVKEAIKRGLDMSLEEGLEVEKQLASLVLSSQDALEGTRAWLENRPPLFQNK